MSIALACASCATTGEHVLGTPSDARIVTGTHPGFEIRSDCPPRGTIAVIGTGNRWFDGAEPGSEARRPAMQAFQARVGAALAGIRSIHTWGLLVVCEREGAGAMLYDWREVDAALAIIERLLVGDDLREQVALIVAARPVLGAR